MSLRSLPWFLAGVLCAAGAAQEQALREAARLDAEGKCREAEPYYQDALAKAPRSQAVLNNAGNHYLVCGQPEQAQSCFERLLKLNPAHANANLQLARLATERKQGSKALEYLARVQDADPLVHLLRAEASHWAGQRGAALDLLKKIEKEAAGDPRLLYTLGVACARMGYYDRAEAAFNGVLAKRPDDFDVLYQLGRAAARARHLERAQRAFEVALKLRPQDPEVLLELGRVHAERQDYGRALYVLAQARQRAPKRPDILLALARAAEDAGYYGDSALAYDEYLQLRPADDLVRRDRARVYGLTGARLNEGLKEMAWYVQKHPGDPVGFFNLAQFTWQNDPQQALDQLAAALRLDPGFVPAHYARAWLLQRRGRLAEALPHLQAAVKLVPNNPRALDQLGLTYLSLDQPAQAEGVLRQALGVAPQDREILLHLGRTLMALGRDDEAQRYLDQFRNTRPPQVRDPRKEAGMIELATLPLAQRTERQIERLRREARDYPNDAELQLDLARLLLADGRGQEAVAAFQELLTRNADSRTWEEAGRALLEAGQHALAKEFLSRAVAERPAARLGLAMAVLFAEGPAEALKVLGPPPEGQWLGDYLLLKARLLDAAGQGAEAQKVLQEGLRYSSSHPQVAQQAALLLLRYERYAEALDTLNHAIGSAPDDPDLLLARAMVYGLMGQNVTAQRALREIQTRWPEWDRPYLAHGLLLERAGQPAAARQRLRTALALGSQDLTARCALARVTNAPAPDARCACLKDLRQWLFPSCEQ